jgi:hypothetical protein
VKIKLIHRFNPTRTPGERIRAVALHLAAVADALVFFASFTLLASEFRSRVIWSDWFDDGEG